MGTDTKSDEVDDRADPLRLARLIRTAKAAGLSPGIADELTEGMARAQNATHSPRSAAKRSGAQRSVEAAAEKATTPAPLARIRDLDIKLRSLVEQDASWTQVQECSWQLFELSGEHRHAARLMELTFLHGSMAEVERVFVRLQKECPDFFLSVHSTVRAHILNRLWRQSRAELLLPFITAARDSDLLLPVERLFLFYQMMQEKNFDDAFPYYRRYTRAIDDACDEVGKHVQYSPSQLRIDVARITTRQGFHNEARQFLEKIPPDDPHYDDALMLLLNLKPEASSSHAPSRTLEQESDPRRRLRQLSEFLESTRQMGGYRDRSRGELNEVLRQPLDWFPDQAASWSDLSRLLFANRDLTPLLPNLLEVFNEHAQKFTPPNFDLSLWAGPLSTEKPIVEDSIAGRYWRGIGHLHRYVAVGPRAEEDLWTARTLVTEAFDEDRQLPFDWRSMHRAAFTHITKTSRLNERERRQMLAQMRIAHPTEIIAAEDIDSYLDSMVQPRARVLEELEFVAHEKRMPGLQARLIHRRASLTHLRNQDLDALWKLACARGHSDTAWRIATVVRTRGKIATSAGHAWSISGENRQHYPLTTPAKAVVDLISSSYASAGQRLVRAIAEVGPQLCELLTILDDQVVAMRPTIAVANSPEGRNEKMLQNLSWLKIPKKRYLLKGESDLHMSERPPFAQTLPANQWSALVMRLSEIFGINSWGWSLSRLQHHVGDLFPRLAARQDLRRHSHKAASWLRSLTPEQRSGWQDLVSLAREITDQEAQDFLSSFLCRLATVMYQHHSVALTSLHGMRAPLPLIWDLEMWITSDIYTDIRRRLGTQTRVLVPKSLRQGASLTSR